jgi:hypothetical protein
MASLDRRAQPLPRHARLRGDDRPDEREQRDEHQHRATHHDSSVAPPRVHPNLRTPDSVSVAVAVAVAASVSVSVTDSDTE